MDKANFFISILPSSFQGTEDFRWNLMNDMDTSEISPHMVSCKKVMREQHEATFLPPQLQKLGEGETSLITVGNKTR